MLIKQPDKRTFFEKPDGLAVGEDALDVDADGALGTVLAADHGEAEAAVAGALLEADVLDGKGLVAGLAPALPRQGAKLGALLVGCLNNVQN